MPEIRTAALSVIVKQLEVRKRTIFLENIYAVFLFVVKNGRDLQQLLAKVSPCTTPPCPVGAMVLDDRPQSYTGFHSWTEPTQD